MPIHEFWTSLLPQFQENAEFIYYFLDVVTAMVIIKLLLSLPKWLLFGTRGDFKW